MSDQPGKLLFPHRYRSKTGLRPLKDWSIREGEAFLFKAGEARHDRVKLGLEARVRFDPAQTTVLDLTGDLDHRGIGGDPDIFRLVTRRPDRHWRISTVKDTWLFNVHGDVRQPHPGFLTYKLDIDVNPTRFWAHQPSTDPAQITALPAVDALRANPAVREQLQDLTLDGGDNVLTSLDQLGGIWFPSHERKWDAVLDVYIQKIRELMEASLRPPRRYAEIDSFRLYAKQAEVYWELETPEATTWVSSLRKALCSADGMARFSTYGLASENRGNTECVSLDKGIFGAKIYAKTPDRVRIEIDLRSHIAQTAKRAGSDGSEAALSLKFLRNDAERRVHKLWRGLMSLDAGTSEDVELFEFLGRFNSAVPTANRAVLLRLLGNHRRVCPTGPNGYAPPAVLRALERLGIIRKASVRNKAEQTTYAVTGPYTRFFDKFLDRNDAPPRMVN